MTAADVPAEVIHEGFQQASPGEGMAYMYRAGVEAERVRIVAALRACADEGATILVEPFEMAEVADMIELAEL